MADILWLLHTWMLLLYFICNPTLALSFDMVLNIVSHGECVQTVVCKQDLIGDAFSWSVRLIPNDLLSLGKSVHSIEGDIILLSSLPHSENNNIQEQQTDEKDFDICSVNCSTFFSKQSHVFLQSAYNLTEAGRQAVFDILKPGNREWDLIIHNIGSLLSKDKWDTYIVFASSFEILKAISSHIMYPSSTWLLFTMDDDKQLNHTLESLFSVLEKKDLNFIVVCSVTCIMDFLNQVYRFEAMVAMTSNKWLVVPTEGFLGDIVNSTMEIPDADIVVMDQTPHRQESSLLNWDELRQMLSGLDFSDASKAYSGLTDFIDETRSSVSASVYVMKRLHEEKKIRRIGHISEDGDVVVAEDLFPGFKYGFKNRTLTVSTLKWPPFVYKEEVNGTVTYSGVSIDLLQELSRGLNFRNINELHRCYVPLAPSKVAQGGYGTCQSYRIVEPEDQEWGREVNGKWTGLVGEMAFRRTDLVVAPITVLPTRESVMDFTVPYFYIKSAIMMMKPDPNTNKWKTLVAPFRYEIHICILFSLIFSTLFLFIVEEIHPVNTWTDNRLSARRTRYGDILWYHFGALMANGGAYLPTSQAGRSVLGCWWLFTVISAAIYSGNLIAFLTDWREKPPFTSLEEMVEQDTYKWGTLGATSYIDTFKNSNRSLHKKVWRGLQSDSEFTSLDVDVHIRKVLDGQYAYLGDETLAQWWGSSQCDLYFLHDPFFLLNYAVGLHNNSVYTKHFTEQVLRINELGLPRMWYQDWKSKVQCETARSVKRVDLLALQSAFYAAGVGVLLCLSVLMIEVVYNRRKYRQDSSSTTVNNDGETESETRL